MIEDDFSDCSVLLVEDEPHALDCIERGLRGCANRLLRCEARPERVLALASEMTATAVLIDLRLPRLDGFELTRQLRAQRDTECIAVIVFASEDEAQLKARAFAAGASDFLVKWPDPNELVARVRYHSGACVARRQRDAALASLRLLQEQLVANQSALHQAQTMEAIGQLTGGVAHDFNNVLQIIGGNLQLLKLMGGLNDAARSRVEMALSGVERGARMAGHLLAFARRQPLQAVVLDPGALLREMDDVMRHMLGPQARIVIEVEAGLWPTSVDPKQLADALLNLAINGRDAMEGGGTLTIRAANVRAHMPVPSEVRPGEYVLIEVSDTGRGMAPEVLRRAFEPFFTTKPVGQGTGLGLSMAHGFVKQSGGEIILRSAPGAGTSVTIYLPRSEAGPAAREPGPPGPLLGGQETILVVEDEHGVRESTCGILAALGYRVLQACDAAAALAIIESGQHIDLVFTDVIMPGPVSSLQLGKAVRDKLPDAQILYTSGYAEGVLAHEGKLDASVHLLHKPYHPDALSSRIRQLLHRKRHAAGAAAVPSDARVRSA
jgi:signal transduction histidine kinase